MNKLILIAAIALSINSNAQKIRLDSNKLEAVKVFMATGRLMGNEAVRVIKDSSVKKADEPTFVKIKGINFKNGTIEVKVLSRY